MRGSEEGSQQAVRSAGLQAGNQRRYGHKKERTWEFLLLFLIFCGVVGCVPSRMIDAEKLDGPLTRVLERHDACLWNNHESHGDGGCEQCLEREVALGDSIAVRAVMSASLPTTD